MRRGRLTVAAGAAPMGGAAPSPSASHAAGSRWTARYEPGVPADVPPADGPLTDLLASAAATSPTFPALSCLGRVVTYAALAARADRVAAALRRDGIGPGARVLVALPACPEALAATWGALRAGAVVSHVDPEDAAAVARGASGAAVAIVTAGAAAALGPDVRAVRVDPAHSLPPTVRLLARLAAPRSLPSGLLRGVPWPRWTHGAADDLAPPEADGPALATADVTFHHRHLVAAAAQLRAWLPDAVPGGETWLALTPIGDPFGFVALFGAAVALRARVVLLPRWRPLDVVDALRVHRPTWVVADAAAVHRLVEDPAFAWADVRSVRAWLVGGPLPRALERAFEESTGVAPCVGLRAPGAAGLLTCQPVNGRRVAGSVGLPLPGVAVRERDDGWIGLRSPTVARPTPVTPGMRDAPGAPPEIVVHGALDAEGYLRLAAAPDGA